MSFWPRSAICVRKAFICGYNSRVVNWSSRAVCGCCDGTLPGSRRFCHNEPDSLRRN